MSDGWRRAWPVALLLAALPAVSWLAPSQQRSANTALLLAAWMALTWIATRTTSRRAGTAFLVHSRSDPASNAWTLGLLAIALSIAVLYQVIGSREVEITQNDGAYYYGVARHMALTGRFEEPIVWHFLAPPDGALHAPFDYWQPMTSLLLTGPLRIFGVQPETAFLTLSAVSAASLIAFWYLVCVALPLRYAAAQLLALLVFALSPAMSEYRFQPESIAIVQFLLLCALIAFCRGRLLLAVLLGFCLFLTRGDGLVLFGIIFLATLVRAASPGERPAARVCTVVAVGGACLVAYVVWSLASFGTVTPPGSARVPFLHSYWEVFDFGPHHDASLGAAVAHHFTWEYLSGCTLLAWLCLRWIPFAPAPAPWFGLALVPLVRLFRGRPFTEVVIWLLYFAGLALVVWLSGSGFYFGRTPYTFTPLAILAGALGADALLAWLDGWVTRSKRVRMGALLSAVAVFGVWWYFFTGLPPLTLPPAARRPNYRALLARLDPVLGGDVVASNVPWYMIAYTHSPAVSVPFNGEAAIEGVLDRYHVRWLVIFGAPLWVQGESRSVLERVLAGDQTNVGRFRVERVSALARLAVFRVQDPGSEKPAIGLRGFRRK